MENEHSASSVTHVVNVPTNLLSQWTALGLIKPSTIRKGSGSRNGFSTKDICKVKLFATLIESGLSRQKASEFIFSDSNNAVTTEIENLIDRFSAKATGKNLGPFPKSDTVYAIFSSVKNEEVEAEICRTSEELAEVYDIMTKKEIFFGVNLTLIVKDALKKIALLR